MNKSRSAKWGCRRPSWTAENNVIVLLSRQQKDKSRVRTRTDLVDELWRPTVDLFGNIGLEESLEVFCFGKIFRKAGMKTIPGTASGNSSSNWCDWMSKMDRPQQWNNVYSSIKRSTAWSRTCHIIMQNLAPNGFPTWVLWGSRIRFLFIIDFVYSPPLLPRLLLF